MDNIWGIIGAILGLAVVASNEFGTWLQGVVAWLQSILSGG